MFRLFNTIVFILILLVQSGCKEKTIPATQEPPKQEQALPSPISTPLPVDPFAPRLPLKNNAIKDEPALPAPVEKLETKEKTVSPATDFFAKALTEEKSIPATPTNFDSPSVPPTEAESVNPMDKPKEEVSVPNANEIKAEPTSQTPSDNPPPDPFTKNSTTTENSDPKPPTPSGFDVMPPTAPETLSETPAAEPPTIEKESVKPKEPEPDTPAPTERFVTPSINPLRQTEEVLSETDTARFKEEKTVQKPEVDTIPPVAEKIMQEPEVVVAPLEVEKTEQKPEIVATPFDDTTPKTEQPKIDTVRLDNDEKKPFDPITTNGELFVDWPKPKLLLVFTGFMNGYVEPCGCAGMEQMKGGLSRRHTFFKELEEKKGWPVLPIDAGNLNKGFGRQEELKFNIVIDEAFRLMKYQAVGIGDRELLLPTDALILYCVDVPGIPRRYTSANIAIMDFDPDFTAPYRIFVQNGVKVGITSAIAPSLLKNINNDDIKHEDAVQRLKAILPKLIEEKCDKRVLTVYGSPEEIKQIIKSVPGQFDYVIPSDTPAEPPFRPNWIDQSMLIEVGEKGKFAVTIGLYDDPETPFRYQRIPFDSRFENSKPVVALMQYYQEQLKETGLQGLGIKPIPNRRAIENGKFIGSQSCADCHEASFSAWKKSKHAAAWQSLAETSKPSRTFDPECIACHVVGWNPAEFLPYEHGFQGEKATPQLLNVGCESCHGPGENHIKAEQSSDAVQQEKLRQSVRLSLEGNTTKKVCMQCHDGDNSPHFNFETYWQKIVHKD